jgi:hypothetical protein
MPWLDHGILFLAAEEDPRIKSGGDEKGGNPHPPPPADNQYTEGKIT